MDLGQYQMGMVVVCVVSMGWVLRRELGLGVATSAFGMCQL